MFTDPFRRTVIKESENRAENQSNENHEYYRVDTGFTESFTFFSHQLPPGIFFYFGTSVVYPGFDYRQEGIGQKQSEHESFIPEGEFSDEDRQKPDQKTEDPDGIYVLRHGDWIGNHEYDTEHHTAGQKMKDGVFPGVKDYRKDKKAEQGREHRLPFRCSGQNEVEPGEDDQQGRSLPDAAGDQTAEKLLQGETVFRYERSGSGY